MFNRLYKVILWLLGIGIVLATFVIGAYFSKFHGGLSGSSADWADFGSLLAGVFTFCSALATITTLLFIHKENEDNRNIIQQQTEALAFEQYLKHREIFIKILTDTAKSCPRKIELYNLDELYKKIFPNNSPTSRPSYSVELKSGNSCLPGDLSDIVESYKTLEKLLKSKDPSCAFHIVKIMGMLKINSTEEPANGDLIFSGANTGINIYNLESKTSEAFKTINAILYFTGNKEVKDINHHANNSELKIELIKHFNNASKPDETFYATKKDPWLRALEEVYIRFNENPHYKHLFNETAHRIQTGFSGRDEVEILLDGAENFFHCYMQEYSRASNKKENHSEKEKKCMDEAHRTINKLQTIYRLKRSLRK